jgi:hypothetical protein
MAKKDNPPNDATTEVAQADALQASPGVQQQVPQPAQAQQAAPNPETGDVRTDERTTFASNTSGTLLTLEDGTPFPRSRKKWLTRAEAERFSRFNLIAILQ